MADVLTHFFAVREPLNIILPFLARTYVEHVEICSHSNVPHVRPSAISSNHSSWDRPADLTNLFQSVEWQRLVVSEAHPSNENNIFNR